ncbi:hypothetical protein GCM10008959_26400 [Deinococcus seoulensis]|uniref:D-glucuronyl C5-epimerase C-terminal domain-containing protein n=1 Tax=Deinococcus seoulensis TaxID=1837379 RepID=A0ABQ2RUK9_9DEIO|nr:D-glucuronyl C5-epimerase family protein [Deinococcus seoulensis]GGR63020.1 hypothetical protein GCM10008959_26400 [Deinococcus seoulensis]
MRYALILGLGLISHAPAATVPSDATLLRDARACAAPDARAGENWPAVVIKPSYKEYVDFGLNKFKTTPPNYWVALQAQYDPFGSYLNYHAKTVFRDSAAMKMDDQGLPTVKYANGTFHYNPVTMAQFVLHQHSRMVKGFKDAEALMIAGTDKLLELQDDQGAFRYDFEYKASAHTFKPGWVSGMAQGQALSALARAYRVTNDTRYLVAGNKALRFGLLRVADGGTLTDMSTLDKSLKRFLFLDEYPAAPSTYTFNGFMFGMLGFYDWSVLRAGQTDGTLAKAYFDCFANTLEHITPYYDIGGFTSYDMGFITAGTKPNPSTDYHGAHIYLLHALYTVTKNPMLEAYREKYRGYITTDPLMFFTR